MMDLEKWLTELAFKGRRNAAIGSIDGQLNTFERVLKARSAIHH